MHEPPTHTPEQQSVLLLQSRPDWKHVEQTPLLQVSRPQQSLIIVQDWPVPWQLPGSQKPMTQFVEQHAVLLPHAIPRPWHAPA